MSFDFSVLEPKIQLFIATVLVVGPMTIIGLIYFLKKIEATKPEKIRWR